MRDHNDLITEELDMQNQQLIHDLQHLYTTETEDSVSLASIRERLSNKVGTLPTTRSTDKEPPIILLETPQKESQRPLQFIRPVFHERSSWQRRLSVIAAVIVATVLVASTLALFIYKGQQTAAPKNTVPVIKKVSIQNTSVSQIKLRSDWSEVITLQGFGNKTITSPQIPLSRLWGYTTACEGGGKMNIQIDTDGSSGIAGASTGGECDTHNESASSGSGTPTIGPDGVILAPAVRKLTRIAITAPAHTRWQLQFAKPAVSLPVLTTPGPDWKVLYTSAGVATDMAAGGLDDGTTMLPKVWGIEYLCVGSGAFTMSLYKNDLQLPIFQHTDACSDSMSTHFEKVTDKPNAQIFKLGNAGGSIIHGGIEVNTDETHPNLWHDWQFLIVGCTNTKTDCK